MNSQQNRTLVQPWSSRIAAMWRSVLSWMRFRQRARQRRLQELTELRERLLFALLQVMPTPDLIEHLVNKQLMAAMQPLAAALERQDNLLLEQMSRARLDQRLMQNSLEDLLKEVLNSLQPPVETQLLPPNGLSSHRVSYPNLRT